MEFVDELKFFELLSRINSVLERGFQFVDTIIFGRARFYRNVTSFVSKEGHELSFLDQFYVY